MPGINLATCDAETLGGMNNAYCRSDTTGVEDAVDFRARILADARASAAPSEDAIREREREAFRQGVIAERSTLGVIDTWMDVRDRLYPAPRPVYAAPVRLSDGRTFGQTGPDAFELARSGVGKRVESAKDWRLVDAFTPADGALVLAVLDGEEATR